MKASFLNSALAYAVKGRPVFPLAPGTKIPTKGSRGYLDATKRETVVRACWERIPDANIGMPTGAVSGLVVIDEDPRNGGDVDALHLPPTRTARTPSGGRHFYFTLPAGMNIPKDNTGKLGEGIDFLGDGAYVVLPPSQVDGTSYSWVDRAVRVAELPPELWPRLLVQADPAKTNGKHPALAAATDGSAEPIAEGRRNGTLTSLAGTMRRRGMSEAEIAAALLAVNAARCVPPLPDAEVARIAKSVSRYAPAAEGAHTYSTNAENAENDPPGNSG